MRIIIVGAGKTAEVFVQHLEKSSHDVILIDKNKDKIEKITNEYSVNGVCGSGASRDVLLSAGADTADVLISLTPVDEINLLACSMAKSLGTSYTIAQLERDELLGDEGYLREKFEIDYILTPKILVCEKIADQVCFNSANRVEQFFDSSVLLAEITVDKDSILADAELKNIKPMLNADFLVFGVLRNDKLMVPKGEFVLKVGDAIGIIADKEEMTNLFAKVNLTRKPVRSVMLIGGGDIGASLAALLSSKHISVKVVESDINRCRELTEQLPKAKIIYGSETDVELLEDEGIAKCDACICSSESDEANLLSSLIAWTNGVGNIITKINAESYDRVLRKATINITISPDRSIAEKLLEYLLSIRENGKNAGMSRYYSMGSAMLKISGFNIPSGFPKADKPLMCDEMRLKKGVIIGVIARGDKMIIPKGSDVIRAGDKIFVLSENAGDIRTPLDIFA